jgi:flagellar biosynthesis/type III secretory pathway M-ring protein FliF/YscJ
MDTLAGRAIVLLVMLVIIWVLGSWRKIMADYYKKRDEEAKAMEPCELAPPAEEPNDNHLSELWILGEQSDTIDTPWRG